MPHAIAPEFRSGRSRLWPRRLFSCHFLSFVLALTLLTSTVHAQNLNPRIGYVYPAGGRQGATFQVTVGGQQLEGVDEVIISGTGVKGTVVEHIKPLTPAQGLILRDKLKELQDKKAAARSPESGPATRPATQPATRPTWTAEDEKQLLEILKKLSTFIPVNKLTPAIAENAILSVTIAPDADLVPRELRLRTPQGLTNPMAFQISQLPEVSRRSAHLQREPKNGLGKVTPPEPDTTFTLPATLNGQIMPGAVERFHFQASKGQQLVIAVQARSLIPYISDAVPGWFQAAVALFDAKGNEVAFADHDRHQPDPVLHYQVPSDGEYTLEIHDSIYRGREDFVYRIAVGEIPWITSIFPRGGKAGGTTHVELAGWNLPAATAAFNAKDEKPGVYRLSVNKAGVASNTVPFAVDDVVETSARGPGSPSDAAQALASLPTIINGRIAKAGQTDVFSFEGKAGEDFVAEVMARRLDSPLDSVLKLTDAAGKQIAYNDDHEDKGSGLNTHHADSYLRVSLPTTGTYYLQIADIQGKGGPDYSYRLRVGVSRPDFELRVVPASLSARGGSSVPLTVYALRRDGFAGEINLSLRGAASGFALSGAKIPAGQDRLKLTLRAPATHLDEPVPLVMEGRATVQGQSVVHAAVPAEDMMQAFLYRHLVCAQELLAAVSAAPIARANMKILSTMPLMLTPGKTARIEVAMPTSTLIGKVEMELTDPPEGISLQSVTPGREGAEIVISCDAAKAKGGLKGNLIFSAFVERVPPATALNPQPRKRRVPMGALPAVPYEIVGKLP